MSEKKQKSKRQALQELVDAAVPLAGAAAVAHTHAEQNAPVNHGVYIVQESDIVGLDGEPKGRSIGIAGIYLPMFQVARFANALAAACEAADIKMPGMDQAPIPLPCGPLMLRANDAYEHAPGQDPDVEPEVN